MRVLSYQTLLDKQDKLNELVIPNWKEELTREQYEVAILDEVAELLGSVPWKWWKKTTPIDEHNVRIEVVDIVHFFLSIMILENKTSFLTQWNWEIGSSCDPVDTMKIIVDGKLNTKRFMGCIRDLLEIPEPIILDSLIVDLGISGEEVSAYYVAKLALNKFRQEQGYKSGNYQKFKDGVEDNVVLKRAIDEFLEDPEMELDELEEQVIADLGAAYGLDTPQLDLFEE